MKNCIFCKIVKEELEAAILYEDQYVIAFLDIQPINEGHTLVIPKIHVEFLDELTDSIAQTIFVVGKQLMVKIKNNLEGITGFNFILANGKDAGQEVPHVHLHVIPRKPNDGFGYKFGPNYGKQLSLEERLAIAKRILKD